MTSVKIFGAGSIGNHLAYACRRKNWDVTLCDPDTEALRRTKESIYPGRYGTWDSNIKLVTPDEVKKQPFDIVIIGTPPDTHIPVAQEVLLNAPPKILLIEKPVCTPSLEGVQGLLDRAEAAGTMVCVGYNHTLTKNTIRAEELISQGIIGTPLSIIAAFREHWGGIFKAHPWLSGPGDSYLGNYARGGGASGEHSHAINIWQHFSNICGFGRISTVSAFLDIVQKGGMDYDRICLINVRTENGLVGNIAQDVVTKPPEKKVRIQGDKGFIEWICNFDENQDAVCYGDDSGNVAREFFPKKRPDDFTGEVDHIEKLLITRNGDSSPISLIKGLDTMLVISAAHLSHQKKRVVTINYEKGYWLESLEC